MLLVVFDATNDRVGHRDQTSNAKDFDIIEMEGGLPFNGDLSSNIRPKCISLIELGEVGRVSHSVAARVSFMCLSNEYCGCAK